ncbi:MAG: DNA repair protein RecN [Oligoflexales bacterium]
MLAELLVQNLAIVQQSHIEFTSSFNLITGETGAGKSIIIKALRILCGLNRASKEMIRDGASHALLSGTWVLPAHHKTLQILEDYGLCYEDNTVHIRRKISTQGKHTSYINDTPVRTETLVKTAQSLIDFTGQHSSFELKQQHHTDVLDQQINPELLVAYKSLYKNVTEQLQHIREVMNQAFVWQQECEQYRQKIEELKQLSPSTEDYKTLKDNLKETMDRDRQKDTLYKAQTQLQASAEIHQITYTLSEIDSFQDLSADAKQLASLYDDLSYSISTKLANMNSLSDNSEQLQSRIAFYQKMIRKHQCADVEELLTKQSTLSKTFEKMSSAHHRLEEMIDNLHHNYTKLNTLDHDMFTARQHTAQKIDKKVITTIKTLGMPKAEFKTIAEQLSPRAHKFITPKLDPSPNNLHEFDDLQAKILEKHPLGSHHFHFHISSNPGQPLQKMSQVASGGESSRVLLAIKSILASHGPQNTFVFDEIDTGVSGAVAHQMGQLIAKMSKKVQIVCISHSPQIASWANTHFRVEKTFQQHTTQSQIRALSHQERTEEIARFLSGSKTTPESLKNAEKLIEANFGQNT